MSTIIMDAEHDNGVKIAFKHRSEENLQQLLDGKDRITTQKATESASKQFSDYLAIKKLPNYNELTTADLPDILYAFYPAVKPMKSEHYSVQTLKCLCSALARYYRKQLGIDISKDAEYTRANEIFKAVESKKVGKGI